MRTGLGHTALICTTVIAVAFLKYWTPFIEFKMKQDLQARILDSIEAVSPKYSPPPTARPKLEKL